MQTEMDLIKDLEAEFQAVGKKLMLQPIKMTTVIANFIFYAAMMRQFGVEREYFLSVADKVKMMTHNGDSMGRMDN